MKPIFYRQHQLSGKHRSASSCSLGILAILEFFPRISRNIKNCLKCAWELFSYTQRLTNLSWQKLTPGRMKHSFIRGSKTGKGGWSSLLSSSFSIILIFLLAILWRDTRGHSILTVRNPSKIQSISEYQISTDWTNSSKNYSTK